jgi:hypothetical protein
MDGDDGRKIYIKLESFIRYGREWNTKDMITKDINCQTLFWWMEEKRAKEEEKKNTERKVRIIHDIRNVKESMRCG